MSAEREHLSHSDKQHNKESLHLHHDLHKAGAHDNHDKSKFDTIKATKLLPKLELTDHGKKGDQPQIDHKVLQMKVTDHDHKHKPEERLAAAHKLYSSNHKQFSESDKTGKMHHYQIVEKQLDKGTRIAVFELDGKSARMQLAGSIDIHGKIDLDKATNSKATEENHPRSMTKHKPEAESRSREGHHADREQPDTPHRRHRHHAGRSHSESVNRSLDFSQAEMPNTSGLPFDKLVKLDNGMVYLRSKLAVDTDGGADWRKDPTGQSMTSLTNADGSPLDAKNVNYFVLPMSGEYKQMGIKLGDMAWVRNVRTGKMVAAIFGDHGPANKIGEGSQALCRALGLSDDPISGGTSNREIEFLIKPNSGNGKGDIARSQDMMVAKLPQDTPPASSNDGTLTARIVASARSEEGEKLWTAHAGATKNGRLGCAISTSEILVKAGLDINKETSACALVNQLQDRGWDKLPVSQARPGDVIYGVVPGTTPGKGGGNAHVGIASERDGSKLMVYANVSKSGLWTHESASRAFSPNRFGNQIWAFRAPQA